MDGEQVARQALRRLRHRRQAAVHAGVAQTPVASEVAARSSETREGAMAQGPVVVPPGGDRAFLAPLPIAVLAPAPPLDGFLQDTGIETCGDLARLERESVEVRFGPDGVTLWRRARADDHRLIFRPTAHPLPQASLDWLDYELRDAERLLFVVNRLVGTVCEELTGLGLRATELTLGFTLAGQRHPAAVGDGSPALQVPLGAARPTANRTTWMRLARDAFERLELPDAVIGIRLDAARVSGPADRQGDLFDRGFATAVATEEAVARVVDRTATRILIPERNAHPLLERRAQWLAREPSDAVAPAPGARAIASAVLAPALRLQLLPEPRVVHVHTVPRRDHLAPMRFRSPITGHWHPLTAAAGPDRVSGGQWEAVPYAREYWRCVTDDGQMVWLCLDPRDQRWYMQGWWD